MFLDASAAVLIARLIYRPVTPRTLPHNVMPHINWNVDSLWCAVRVVLQVCERLRIGNDRSDFGGVQIYWPVIDDNNSQAVAGLFQAPEKIMILDFPFVVVKPTVRVGCFPDIEHLVLFVSETIYEMARYPPCLG